MAVVEIRTSLCASAPKEKRSGYLPACSCGWWANVTYGSRSEADAVWADTHRLQVGPGHDHAVEGIFVMLLRAEAVDPTRPRVDPVGGWVKIPPRSNRALRRGEEGVEQSWRR